MDDKRPLSIRLSDRIEHVKSLAPLNNEKLAVFIETQENVVRLTIQSLLDSKCQGLYLDKVKLEKLINTLEASLILIDN